MSAPETNTRPPGGFYAKEVAEELVEALPEAVKVTGLDQEIALLRIALNHTLHKNKDVDWDEAIVRATAVVNAVVKRYRINPQGAAELLAELHRVQSHMGAQFGELKPLEDV